MKLWLTWLTLTALLNANGVSEAYLTMKKEAYRYYEHNQKKRAFDTVEAFIAKHPKSLRAQNLLAVLYYWEGRTEDAARLLRKLLKKGNLPEAKRLLARIEKKVPARMKPKDEKVVTKSAGNAKGAKATGNKKQNSEKRKEKFQDDLAFLLEYIAKHPERIQERKFLMRYFLSVNDRKEAKRLAGEILSIDPDEAETLRLAKANGIDISLPAKETVAAKPDSRRDRLVSLLNSYKEAGRYDRYLNLYRALTERGEYLPQYVHLETLDIAVQERAYRLARRILMQNRFKNTPHLRQLRALLDRRLNIASAL